jgi:hypothetical protein
MGPPTRWAVDGFLDRDPCPTRRGDGLWEKWEPAQWRCRGFCVRRIAWNDQGVIFLSIYLSRRECLLQRCGTEVSLFRDRDQVGYPYG